jgi:hypothetical protein
VKLTTKRAAFMLAAWAMLGWTTACQTKTEVKTGNENAPTSNAPAAPAANAKPQAAASQPEAAKTESTVPAASGSLATPTEAYKFGYTARQKKDIAGLKRVMAKDALEFLTMIGQEEKKTLDDQLRALIEKPQASTAETRNEKITGNRARLEYLDENGKWATMDLMKEGDEWKIGLPKGP